MSPRPELPECERKRYEKLGFLKPGYDPRQDVNENTEKFRKECERLRKGLEIFRDAVGMTDETRRGLAAMWLLD